MARFGLVVGLFDRPAAYRIAHTERPGFPERGVSAEFGSHIADYSCRGCHGQNMAGAPVPPDNVLSANLTPAGEMIGWTEQDFATLMQTGRTPTGRDIDPIMPWQEFQSLTDEEISALWLYLQSLPPAEPDLD